MVFNNAECKALDPGYVNKASGLQLHQFKWLGSDDRIGKLHPKWNFLVGEQSECILDSANPANLHYTIGGPWFDNYNDQVLLL